jgi:hypothetical protein
MNQEPDPDAQIKHFAQQYLDLAAGNVMMLAKLNLNSVPCDNSAPDACMPESAGCCPQNDAIYSTLLGDYPTKCTTCNQPTNQTWRIGWNFNKILLDTEGRPWTDEIISGHEENISPWVERMLSSPTGIVSSSAEVVDALQTSSQQHADASMSLEGMFGMLALLVMSLVVMYGATVRWSESEREADVAPSQSGEVYVRILE